MLQASALLLLTFGRERQKWQHRLSRIQGLAGVGTTGGRRTKQTQAEGVIHTNDIEIGRKHASSPSPHDVNDFILPSEAVRSSVRLLVRSSVKSSADERNEKKTQPRKSNKRPLTRHAFPIGATVTHISPGNHASNDTTQKIHYQTLQHDVKTTNQIPSQPATRGDTSPVNSTIASMPSFLPSSRRSHIEKVALPSSVEGDPKEEG